MKNNGISLRSRVLGFRQDDLCRFLCLISWSLSSSKQAEKLEVEWQHQRFTFASRSYESSWSHFQVVVVNGCIYQYQTSHTRTKDTEKAEQNETCLICGLTVRNEIETSSTYLQQQSANIHYINFTVSKESAFGR